MDRGGAWWVFDRPLLRDPLFVLGLVLGVAWMVSVVLRRDDFGWAAFVITLASSIPAGLLASGIVLGSPREYARSWHRAAP
jgi:hypothetical protein